MKRCIVCGFSFDDIIKNKSIGCPYCYETFKKEFISSLKSIGINIGGRNVCQKVDELNPHLNKGLLQKQMERAVIEENYEKAAIYRDYLRALDNETKN